MSNEKKQVFYEVAFKNAEIAKDLMSKTPEEVSKYMADQGYDYSVDEIKEYGVELQEKLDQFKSGELDPSALDDVVGGKGEFWAGVGVGLLIGLSLGGW